MQPAAAPATPPRGLTRPPVPAPLHSGDVSVAFSTETPPVTPLTGTAVVRAGDARVNISDDLRGQLSPGDVLLIGVDDRVDEELHVVHRTARFDGEHFTLSALFAEDALPVRLHAMDIPLPGVLLAQSGDAFATTTEDLQPVLSRGDRVKVGDEQHTVAATGPFNETHLPLSRPYAGPELRGTRPYADQPYSGLSMGDVDTYFTLVPHRTVLPTTASLEAEIAAGDTIKLGDENYVVEKVNATAVTLTDPYIGDGETTLTGVVGFRSPLGVALPGYVAATAGDATLPTTQDLRPVLSVGDRIKVGGRQFRVQLPFTADQLTLDRPFDGESDPRAEAFTDRTYAVVYGRVRVEHGVPRLRTQFDLRGSASRGDTVKVGYRNYVIGGDGAFSGEGVPLTEPFDAPSWGGVVLLRAHPNPASTATPHADYVPAATRIRFPHQVTRQSALVQVLPDHVYEAPDEVVHLRLWDPRFENPQHASDEGLDLGVEAAVAASSPTVTLTESSAAVASDVVPGDVIRVLDREYEVEAATADEVTFTEVVAGGPVPDARLFKARPSLSAEGAHLLLTIANDDPSVVEEDLGTTGSVAAGERVAAIGDDLRNQLRAGDRVRFGTDGPAAEVASVNDTHLVLTEAVAETASGVSLLRASLPDSPGSVGFASSGYDVLESAEGGLHPDPPRPSQLLAGTVAVVVGATKVTTTADLRRDLGPGTTVSFEGSEGTPYTVDAVAAGEVTLRNPYAGAADAPALSAYRALNARRAAVVLARTGGSSGAVSVRLTTCTATQVDEGEDPCGAVITPDTHADDEADGAPRLPGVASGPAGATMLNTSADWRGRVEAGDLVAVAGRVFAVGAYAAMGNNSVPLAEVGDAGAPAALPGAVTGATARALTRRLPGAADTAAGSSSLVSTADLRPWLRPGSLLKVGDVVAALDPVERVPDHAPLGTLPGTVAVRNESAAWLETSRPLRAGRVQRVRCVAEAGHFRLALRDQVTGPIPSNASSADVEAALLLLGRVTAVRVTFDEGLAGEACAPGREPPLAMEIAFTSVWGFDGPLPRLAAYPGDLLWRGAMGAGALQVSLPPSLGRGDWVRLRRTTVAVSDAGAFAADAVALATNYTGPWNDTDEVGEMWTGWVPARRVTRLALDACPSCGLPASEETDAQMHRFLGARLLPFTFTVVPGTATAVPSRDPRPGYVQEVECVADGGSFRLLLGRETTQPVASDAGTAGLRAALERLENVVSAEVTASGRAGLGDGTLCADSWTDGGPHWTVQVHFTAVIAFDEELPALVPDAAALTLGGSTADAGLRVVPGDALRRGDVLLLGHQPVTVAAAAGNPVSASEVPLTAQWEGAALSGVPTWTFTAKAPPRQADHAGQQNVEVSFPAGVDEAVVTVPVYADGVPEVDERIALGIHAPRAECDPSPCRVEHALACDAASGSFALRYGAAGSYEETGSLAAENATAADLEAAIEAMGGVSDVRVVVTTRDGAAVAGGDGALVCATAGDGDRRAHVVWVDPPGSPGGAAPLQLWVAPTHTLAGPGTAFVAHSSPVPDEESGVHPPAVGLDAAAVTVVDRDSAGTLGFQHTAVAVSEGARSVALTVTRGSAGGSVVVQYATRDGTAVALASTRGDGVDGDYVATSGLLHFDHGVRVRVMRVLLLQDVAAEEDETFSVELSGVSGAGAPALDSAASEATVTIMDDEDASSATRGGRVGFARSLVEVGDDEVFGVLEVTREGGAAGQLELAYTLESGDASAAEWLQGGDVAGAASVGGGTLTMPEGVTRALLPVAVRRDGGGDNLGIVRATLLPASSPCSSDACAFEVQDGDAVAVVRSAGATAGNDSALVGLTAARYTVVEDGGYVALTLARRGAPDLPLRVRVATGPPPNGVPAATACPLLSGNRVCEAGNGTVQADYWEVDEVVTLASGVGRATVVVRVRNDTQYEWPDEEFSVTLTAADDVTEVADGEEDRVAGKPPLYASATVAIQDDGDAPGAIGFAHTEVTVRETEKRVWVTVTRTGGASGTVRVQYGTCGHGGHDALCDGRASTAVEGQRSRPGADYERQRGTLEFPPDVRRAVFPIPVLDDACQEDPDEQIVVVLANATTEDATPCGSDGNSNASCLQLDADASVATITIEDPEDGGDEHVAWLNVRQWPGASPAAHVVTLAGPGNASVQGGTFRLRVRDSVTNQADVTLPIAVDAPASIADEVTASDGTTVASVQRRLEELPLVTRVEVVREVAVAETEVVETNSTSNSTSNSTADATADASTNTTAWTWRVTFTGRGQVTASARWSLEAADSTELEPAGSEVSVSASAPRAVAVASEEVLSPAPQVELRSGCDRPLAAEVANSTNVTAALAVPWHHTCLLSATRLRRESQALSLVPLRVLDASVDVVGGLAAVLTTSDLEGEIAAGETVLVGGARADALYELSATATVVDGSRTLEFSASVADEVGSGQQLRIGVDDYNVLAVDGATVRLETVFEGTSASGVTVYRLPLEAIVTGFRVPVEGTVCAESNWQTAQTAEDLASEGPHQIQANDEVSMAGVQYVVTAVTEEKLDLGSGIATSSNTKQLAYRIKAQGGTRHIMALNTRWAGPSATGLRLFRTAKLSGTLSLLHNSTLMVASQNVSSELSAGDTLSLRGVRYEVGDVLDGRVLALTTPYEGTTVEEVPGYLITGALSGNMALTQGGDASVAVDARSTGTQVKAAVEQLVPGSQVSVTRSLSRGGHKWTLQFVTPVRNVPQVRLVPTTVPGPYLARSYTLSDGAARYEASQDGFVRLPVSGSSCGELQGTTWAVADAQGRATFDDLSVSGAGQGYMLQFSAEPRAPASAPVVAGPPPEAGFLVRTPPFAVHAPSALALVVETQPGDVVEGAVFGTAPSVVLRDAARGGVRVESDNTSTVQAALGVNDAGYGGAKLFSQRASVPLALEVSAFAGNLTLEVNATAGDAVAAGDVVLVDGAYYMVMSPALSASLASAGSSSPSPLDQAGFQSEKYLFTFGTSATTGTFSMSRALRTVEGINLFVDEEDVACALDSVPPEYLYWDGDDVQREEDGSLAAVPPENCRVLQANLLRSAIGTTPGLSTLSVEATLDPSVPGFWFTFPGSQGNVTGLSAAGESGDLEVALADHEDGEGGLYPREVQVVRAAVQPTPSLGAFSLQLETSEGTRQVSLLHEAVSMITDRLSCQDGSVEALLLEAAPELGSVEVESVEEQDLDTDTIFRYWTITFTGHDGDLPQMTVAADNLCARTLWEDQNGDEVSVETTYGSTSVTVTGSGISGSDVTDGTYAEVWPSGATYSDRYQITVASSSTDTVGLTIDKAFLGVSGTGGRIFLCDPAQTTFHGVQVTTLRDGGLTIPLFPRYAGDMGAGVSVPDASDLVRTVSAGIATFDGLAVLRPPAHRPPISTLEFTLLQDTSVVVSSQRFAVRPPSVAGCGIAAGSFPTTSILPGCTRSTCTTSGTVEVKDGDGAVDTSQASLVVRTVATSPVGERPPGLLMGSVMAWGSETTGTIAVGSMAATATGEYTMRLFCGYQPRLSYSLRCDNATGPDLVLSLTPPGGQATSVAVRRDAVLRREDEQAGATGGAAPGNSVQARVEALPLVSSAAVVAQPGRGAVCGGSGLVWITLAELRGSYSALTDSVPALSVAGGGGGSVTLRPLFADASLSVGTFTQGTGSLSDASTVTTTSELPIAVQAGQTFDATVGTRTREGYETARDGIDGRDFRVRLYSPVDEERLCGQWAVTTGEAKVISSVDVDTEVVQVGALVRHGAKYYYVTNVSGPNVTLNKEVSGSTSSAASLFLRSSQNTGWLSGPDVSGDPPQATVQLASGKATLSDLSVTTPGRTHYLSIPYVHCVDRLADVASLSLASGSTEMTAEWTTDPPAPASVFTLSDGTTTAEMVVREVTQEIESKTIFKSAWPGDAIASVDGVTTLCQRPYEVQSVATQADGSDPLLGTFSLRLTHQGTTERTTDLNFNATEAEMAAALEALPNVHATEVVRRPQTEGMGDYVWNIAFREMDDVPLLEVYENAVVQDCDAPPCPASSISFTTPGAYSTLGITNSLSGDSGLAGASAAFVVSAGGAQAGVATQPARARGGLVMGQQPRMRVVDFQGIRDGAYTGGVTAVALQPGTVHRFRCFASGGTLGFSLQGPGFHGVNVSIPYDAPAASEDGASVQDALIGVWHRLVDDAGTPLEVVATGGNATFPLTAGSADLRRLLRPGDNVRIAADGDCTETGERYRVPMSGWPETGDSLGTDHAFPGNESANASLCVQVMRTVGVRFDGGAASLCHPTAPAWVTVTVGEVHESFANNLGPLTLSADALSGEGGPTQTLTSAATGGSYRLAFRGAWTSSLAHDAAAGDVEAALEALPTVRDVMVTGDLATGMAVAFASVAELDPTRDCLPLLEADASLLAGGSVDVTGSGLVVPEPVDQAQLTGTTHMSAAAGWANFTDLSFDRASPAAALRFFADAAGADTSALRVRHTLRCRATGGVLYLAFMGAVTGPLSATSLSASALETALEALDTVTDVDVEFRGGVAPGGPDTTSLCSRDGHTFAVITYQSVDASVVGTEGEDMPQLSARFPSLVTEGSGLTRCAGESPGSATVGTLFADAGAVEVLQGRPQALVLVTAPTGLQAGEVLDPAPTLELQDGMGARVEHDVIGQDLVTAHFLPHNRVQRIVCRASGGHLLVRLSGAVARLNADDDAAAVEAALGSLPWVEEVTASFSAGSQLCADSVAPTVTTVTFVAYGASSGATGYVAPLEVDHDALESGLRPLAQVLRSEARVEGTSPVIMRRGRAAFLDLVPTASGPAHTLCFTASRVVADEVCVESVGVAEGAPYALRVVQQPRDVVAGEQVPLPVEVHVVDVGGQRVTADGDTVVTVSVGASSRDTALSGADTSAQVTAGVALLTDLSLDAPAAGVRLNVSAAGVGSVLTAPFRVLGAVSALALGRQPGLLQLPGTGDAAPGDPVVNVTRDPLPSLRRRELLQVAEAAPQLVSRYGTLSSEQVEVHAGWGGASAVSGAPVYRAAAGGEPLPSQPEVELVDEAGNVATGDSASVVTAHLAPNAACGPRLVGGSNHRQTLWCSATEGSVALSFRGEVTPRLAYNASAAEVEAALEALPGVDDVLVAFENGTTLCTEGADVVAVVDLVAVPALGLSTGSGPDALTPAPLLRPRAGRTQRVACNATGGQLALTYDGHTTGAPLPRYSACSFPSLFTHLTPLSLRLQSESRGTRAPRP